jgi:outer membrane protein TolC
MGRWWWLAIVIGGGLWWPHLARADCPPRCDLSDLRRLAQARAPENRQAQAVLDGHHARREEAYLTPLNLGRFELRAAPTGLRRGDGHHHLQDDISFSLNQDLGLWVTLRAQVGLALTPWWQLVHLWRAAKAAVTMGEQEAAMAARGVNAQVDAAFFDLHLAQASQRVLRLARQRGQETVDHVEQLLDDDEPGAVEGDRLQLLMLLANVESQLALVNRDRHRALRRLRRLTGLTEGTPVFLPPFEAPPATEGAGELAPLSWFMETARRLRPEVGLSLAANRAARALVDVGTAKFAPDLVVGAFYSFAEAPVVDDQSSPFMYDPWNSRGLGYGLLLRWHAALGQQWARREQARADVERARAMHRLALGAVALEVEQAYLAVDEQRRAVAALSAVRQRANERYREHQRQGVGSSSAPDRWRGPLKEWLQAELALLRAQNRLQRGLTQLRRVAGAD